MHSLRAHCITSGSNVRRRVGIRKLFFRQKRVKRADEFLWRRQKKRHAEMSANNGFLVSGSNSIRIVNQRDQSFTMQFHKEKGLATTRALSLLDDWRSLF